MNSLKAKMMLAAGTVAAMPFAPLVDDIVMGRWVGRS
jgi:hypothetical protein